MYRPMWVVLTLGCIFSVVHSAPFLEDFAAERSKEIVERSKEIIGDRSELLATELHLGLPGTLPYRHTTAPEKVAGQMEGPSRSGPSGLSPESWNLPERAPSHAGNDINAHGFQGPWFFDHQTRVYWPEGFRPFAGDGTMQPFVPRPWHVGHETSTDPSSPPGPFLHSSAPRFQIHFEALRHAGPAMESSIATPSSASSVIPGFVAHASSSQIFEREPALDPSIRFNPRASDLPGRRDWLPMPDKVVYVKSPWIARIYERLVKKAAPAPRVPHSMDDVSNDVLDRLLKPNKHLIREGQAYFMQITAEPDDGAPFKSMTVMIRHFYPVRKASGPRGNLVSFWSTIDNGNQLALLGVFRTTITTFEHLVKARGTLKYSIEKHPNGGSGMDRYLIPEKHSDHS